MTPTNQFTAPLIIEADGSKASSLERLPLQASGGGYDERWLQDVLYRNPTLIPTEELEPVFGGAVPICMELPTNVGPLDLVYINEQGLLTLTECKLWRNPEARRKVVGQILDYAQEISRWTYDELDAAIARSEARMGSNLWEIARAAFGLEDEAVFIDRVSRHLRAGSFLLIIVGDGIRENTENIAAFLQQHAGLSFAFGLVEERLFLVPGTKQILVQPRILAKTVELGRYIVTTDAGVTSAVESTERKVAGNPRFAQTLTETMFIEGVAGNSAMADELRDFFAELKEAGMEIQPTERGVSLKVVPIGTKQNLLTLERKGTVRNHGCGNTEIGRRYLEALRDLVAGSKVSEVRPGSADDGWSNTIQRGDGTAMRVDDILPLRKELVELFREVADQLRASEQ
jgi:hypothetical protein